MNILAAWTVCPYDEWVVIRPLDTAKIETYLALAYSDVIITTTPLQLHHYSDVIMGKMASQIAGNRLFGRRSKKTSKLHATGLCEGNPPVIGEFPAQRTSNAENVSN